MSEAVLTREDIIRKLEKRIDFYADGGENQRFMKELLNYFKKSILEHPFEYDICVKIAYMGFGKKVCRIVKGEVERTENPFFKGDTFPTNMVFNTKVTEEVLLTCKKAVKDKPCISIIEGDIEWFYFGVDLGQY